MAEQAEMETVDIARIETETIHVPIVGVSPIIVHRFAEKAKQDMLRKQQGKKVPKTNRDPEADYQAAFHIMKDGRYGFPASGVKKTMVSAARFFGKDVTMVMVKQTVFVHGEPGKTGPEQLVVIEGEPTMVEDVVRLSGKTADLRYRPYFYEWSSLVPVTYVKAAFSRDSILSLLDAGGLGVGLGEWRPERGGTYGQFKIDETRNVEIIN